MFSVKKQCFLWEDAFVFALKRSIFNILHEIDNWLRRYSLDTRKVSFRDISQTLDQKDLVIVDKTKLYNDNVVISSLAIYDVT